MVWKCHICGQCAHDREAIVLFCSPGSKERLSKMGVKGPLRWERLWGMMRLLQMERQCWTNNGKVEEWGCWGWVSQVSTRRSSRESLFQLDLALISGMVELVKEPIYQRGSMVEGKLGKTQASCLFRFHKNQYFQVRRTQSPGKVNKPRSNLGEEMFGQGNRYCAEDIKKSRKDVHF